MSVYDLLNLLNELGKNDKLLLFLNEFNNFNNTRARMLDYIYRMSLRILCNLIPA